MVGCLVFKAPVGNTEHSFCNRKAQILAVVKRGGHLTLGGATFFVVAVESIWAAMLRAIGPVPRKATRGSREPKISFWASSYDHAPVEAVRCHLEMVEDDRSVVDPPRRRTDFNIL